MTNLINWDYRKNKGIVWCYPVNKKDKGFMVRQGQEVALWLQKGRLLDVILDGYSYEFKNSSEKDYSELIYMKSGEIRIQWGIPMRNGIITADQVMIGCHGIFTIKIISPQDFIFNLVSSQACLFHDDIEKEIFLSKDKSKEEIIKKKVAEDQLNIQDAKRLEEPYLFTKNDIKTWVLPVLKQILREKLSAYKLSEIMTINEKELEQDLRVLMNKQIGKWGLELYSFSMLGWNIPSR
ncbi:MAG: SPFH domain-containing protein [Candidatus Helarchaeota archaeon]